MAPPRTQTSFTPGQALYILEKAIADRKLSASEISGYMRSMADEIRSLEDRIAALAGAVGQAVVAAAPVAAQVQRSVERTVRDVKKIRKSTKASAERVTSMKLQGPKSQRAGQSDDAVRASRAEAPPEP